MNWVIVESFESNYSQIDSRNCLWKRRHQKNASVVVDVVHNRLTLMDGVDQNTEISFTNKD